VTKEQPLNMASESDVENAPEIDPAIRTLRGVKVILDADLARIYGVPTGRLNEQVRRNFDRFPSDFLFQLTSDEVANLRSQIAISSVQPARQQEDATIRSRFATRSHGGRRYAPYAFTEHGAIMAANVLNTPRAVQMSVFVVRAFIKLREQLLNRAELEKWLADIERALMGHDTALRDLYQKIRPLLLPPPDPPKKEIGFHVKESRLSYRVSRNGRRS
jgi:hypothetical protein